MCKSPLEQFREIVSKGVFEDLFRISEAKEVCIGIAYWSMEINKSGFGRFFANVQRANSAVAIMHTTRIFERSKAHCLRSIPAALKVLEDHANTIKISNRFNLKNQLSQKGFDPNRLSEMSDADLTNSMIDYVRNRLPRNDPKLSIIEERLKTRRDKQIAHNEVFDWEGEQAVTFVEIEQLLEPASEFVALVGVAYLETSYAGLPEPHFSGEGKRTLICMERMLVKLGIIEKKENSQH